MMTALATEQVDDAPADMYVATRRCVLMGVVGAVRSTVAPPLMSTGVVLFDVLSLPKRPLAPAPQHHILPLIAELLPWMSAQAWDAPADTCVA